MNEAAARGLWRRCGATASLLGALVALAAPARAQSRLLATLPGDGDVVAIDLASGAVAARFDAGSLPAGAVLSADGSRLYVADASAGELRVFETTGTEIDSVAVGAGPAGVALCTGGARVAVALAAADAVAVVDTATLAVVATLPVGDQPLAVACADGFLAAASYGTASVSVFDATTLVSLGSAPVGSFPAGVAVAAGRAWVSSLFDSTVTVVTLATGTVAATVPVGSAPRAIAATGGRVFVADLNDGALTVLDAVSASVVGTVALPHPAPTDLLVDATSGNLLVAHLGEPAISVVDPASLAVTGTVSAPVGMLALAGVALGGGVVPMDVPALGRFGLLLLAATLALLGLRWRGGLAVALLFAAIAFGAPARAQTATFSESTFFNADWEVFSASGSHSEGQTSLDGNPQPSRQMTHFQDSNQTVRVFHRWVTASYDPATSGAVASLDVSRDHRTCGGDGPLAEVAESFVVYQDGVAYAALESSFSSSTWETATQSGLTEQDFDDGLGGVPDFSTAGGPISFGYARTTTSTSEPFAVTCHAIDNLTVAVQAQTPAGTSSIGFAQRDYFVLDGEDLVVRVSRGGDVSAPASVDVLLTRPPSGSLALTVNWPAGAGGERTATYTPSDLLGEGLAVRKLLLADASAGAVIDPSRDKGMVFRGSGGLSGLWAVLLAALARWDLASLLLLGAGAAFMVVRRRRQQPPREGAGEGAVEVGIHRRRAAEHRGGGPEVRALDGELDGERGEQGEAHTAVASQYSGAARGEEAVEQGGEPGHDRRARREEQHAKRSAEPAGERGDEPLARRELAPDRHGNQRQPCEVPGQVLDVEVHDRGGEQAPDLAVQHGAARVAERGEAAATGRGGRRADEREHDEGNGSAQGAPAWWHSFALGPIAAVPALRRRRVALWLLVAVPGLVASWGCVGTGDVNVSFVSARFNERIASDLQRLSPEESATDLRFGVFRDGTIDPDGSGPRRGGLVSEIFPVAAAAATAGVPSNLVQTPCLFSGRNGASGDELRVSWEVVAKLDRSADDYLKKALLEMHEEVGLCTFSTPETRLLFEDPGADQPMASEFAQQAVDCEGSGAGSYSPHGFSFPWTLQKDPTKNRKNRPWPCRFPVLPWMRVEAFVPSGQNPEAACPESSFAGGPLSQELNGCLQVEGLWPACALPCGLEPMDDASYKVSIDRGTGQPAAERFLLPNVLVVDRTRTMVRAMDRNPSDFTWQTKVVRSCDPHCPAAPEGPIPVRWTENFSPTVRVATVQILSRNSSGGDERVETPASGRLTVEIPRPGQMSPTLFQCTGAIKDSAFTFSIADCASSTDEPAVLAALTPTYLVQNLHLDPVVTQPITWHASLSALATDRRAFIRFGLEAQTMGAALRVSAAHNFGRLPRSEYHQGSVELENVGGETITVNAVDLVPGVGTPQDFAFFVVGDPVPVPLPFEATTGAGGVTTLRLGDLREAPLVGLTTSSNAVTVRLGDPAAPPGAPQSYTLYGERTQWRGGVLTRDRPNAVFRPASAARRPLVLPAFAQQTPPFVLRPGERRQIVVEARPTALGQRQATLRIRGVPGSNPSQTLEVRSQLAVEVVSGPLLNFLPQSLYVFRDANGDQPAHLNAVLENAGAATMTVSSLQLTGSGAARFVLTSSRGMGPFTLAPGASAALHLEYLPECDGVYGSGASALDHQATFAVTTNGGNAAIAVGGASQGFCE